MTWEIWNTFFFSCILFECSCIDLLFSLGIFQRFSIGKHCNRLMFSHLLSLLNYRQPCIYIHLHYVNLVFFYIFALSWRRVKSSLSLCMFIIIIVSLTFAFHCSLHTWNDKPDAYPAIAEWPQTSNPPISWDLFTRLLISPQDVPIPSPLNASIALVVRTSVIRASVARAEQSFFCLSVEIHTLVRTRNTLCVWDSSSLWLLCCVQKYVVASHHCLRGVNERVAKETVWAASSSCGFYQLTALRKSHKTSKNTWQQLTARSRLLFKKKKKKRQFVWQKNKHGSCQCYTVTDLEVLLKTNCRLPLPPWLKPKRHFWVTDHTSSIERRAFLKQ